MLSEGDQAPDFAGTDQNGNSITLDQFTGQKLVLYFYPKDDTPGCTKEACSLRDSHDILQDAGITILGVSADNVASHERFADKYNLPFTLIADPDGEIIEQYDVEGRSGNAKRVTYVIDEDGVIGRVYTDVDVDQHAEQILNDISQ